MVAVEHPIEGGQPRPDPARHRPVEHRPPVLAAVAVAVLAVLGGPAADAAADLVAGPRGAVAGAEAPAPPPEGSVVQVRAGETYWSIAERLGAHGDLRAAVDELVAGNGGRPLRAGDRLVLPG